MTRSLIFSRTWSLALGAAFVIAVPVALLAGGEERVAMAGAVGAAVLGALYFVEQQRLGGIELFHKLFTEFNARYDALNGKLEAMRARDTAVPLSSGERDTFADYFNLCAEEYFFYSAGYIHQDVWRSWCNGMLYYLAHPRVQEFWDKEVTTSSHYGLTKSVIEAGALTQ